MKRKFTTSFDELIKNYYGDSSRSAVKDAVTIEELFANYYGKAAIADEEKKKSGPALALSLCHDDGEILAQRSHRKRGPRYGYQESIAAFEEYVIGDNALATQSSVGEQREAVPAGETSVFEEYTVDVLAPLEETKAAGLRTAPDSYQSAPAAPPAAAARPPIVGGDSGETSRTKASDDDFIADMQSILTGQKVFDPLSKKTVDKENLSGTQSTPSPNNLPVPQGGDGQAIFDRIAQSMQYANAYDLGTVELENRFSDFDRMSELQQKAAQDKKTKQRQSSDGEAAPSPRVDSEDFIQDLDAIRQEHYGSGRLAGLAESFAIEVEPDVSLQRDRDPACLPFTLSLEDPEYSRPLYDAGEHVRPARDMYANQLRVGKAPGVMFSYGHLLAMGDLYANVDQMMNADVSELREVQSLIERSTQYYEKDRDKRKNFPSLDVTNEMWDKATGDRYLELAADNYEHFSPNVLFADAIAKAANKRATNKSTWEAYHERAIKEAQKMWLDPKHKNLSFLPEWPLIISAFGDHFLTDAFASGHLINKEVMIAYFKANFFTGGSLKPAAKKFFERVAHLAFGPWWKMTDVRRKFSVLETTNYPVCAHGWCLKVHLNIDTEGMFEELLVQAATQEPDKVANFAVKALHDRLNEDGIEVTNQAGDGKWTLTGDGFLNPKSLAIMRRAVQQSVNNINDPSIQASNLNFGAYFAKVWKHVPQLTEPSKQKVISLMKDYTRPESTVLSKAAADIITKQVDSVIKVLIKEGKLQPA